MKYRIVGSLLAGLMACAFSAGAMAAATEAEALAKQQEKEAKELARQQEKAAKALLKQQEKAAKELAKQQEKAAKELAKQQEKAAAPPVVLSAPPSVAPTVTAAATVSATQPTASSATAQQLDPTLPPGWNFNLAPFTLQLPTGASGKVDTVSGTELEAGYENPTYFYTDTKDGAMVMMDPVQGWTTSGSKHPRTELREKVIWPATGTNKLNATLAVTLLPTRTTVGQIFQGTGPSKPLCEVMVGSDGVVQLMVEKTNQGGSADFYPITNVPLGQVFSYELGLTGMTLTINVNGVIRSFTIDSSFAGESFYFKAGNYDQTAVSGTPLTTPGTIVKFYALKLTHQQ